MTDLTGTGADEEWDVVIAGAGSSGCALAGRLSEDPKLRVLLVEAGPWDNSPFIKLPKGLTKLRAIPQRVYHYAAERRVGGDSLQPETLLRGRGLGGSSTLNGMVYHRGQPQDYDDWEALGLPGWGWADVLPCFLGIEDNHLPPTDWRGRGGPLPLRVARKLPPLADALMAAGGDLGLPRKEEPNLPQQLGMSPIAANIDDRGHRVTSAHAFLPPAVRRRPNLRILPNTRVDRVLFQGKRAVGLQCQQGGVERRFRAAKYVVLSLGALETPRLLQISGVGPAEHLAGLGVRPVVDLPGVGENYRDHFCYGSSWRLRHSKDSENREFSGWRLPVNLLRYYGFANGPMSTSVAQLSMFPELLPGGTGRPDAEVLWFPWNMAAGRNAAAIALDSEPGGSLTGFPLRGTSQGTVMAGSADPAERPVVRPNYLATDYDRSVMIGLVRFTQKMMSHPRLQPFVASGLGEAETLRTEDEILDYIARKGSSGQHGCGTCKMGTADDPLAVLDEKLSVRGVDGLKVVDCSIMPSQISGNTNGPAMMIGWRASEILKLELR